MYFLKNFNNHSEYEAFVSGGTMELPNVSRCITQTELHYNPRLHDYRRDYLTFEALESGTISFNIWKNMGTDMITSISYSTDDGETWVTTNNTNGKTNNLQITVNVNSGDTVLWKGTATQTGCYDEDEEYNLGSFFSSTCRFNAKGNIMSMLYGDNFTGQTTLTEDGSMASLFSDYDGVSSCGIVDAADLVLPATTLANSCYYCMFSGCASLTAAPSLPVTTLASSCYRSMFSGCKSLTTAPELPATTLASRCYQGMFGGCTSLTTAPVLTATTLANSCYESMFNGCTSLTSAPALPVTTLASSCYRYIFYGCTSLATAPELPATTLADYCYNGMFYGCTSLTTAPVLTATTLASSCYGSMFQNCTSLTTVPALPATTLASSCYRSMFQNCTSLTTAPELPATTLAEGCYGSMF